MISCDFFLILYFICCHRSYDVSEYRSEDDPDFVASEAEMEAVSSCSSEDEEGGGNKLAMENAYAVVGAVIKQQVEKMEQ